MIDFSNIGQNAFIIQYEDLISLMGLNCVRYIFKKQNKSYDDQLTLDYLNRTDFDIAKFVKKQTGIDFPYEKMLESKIACQPNLAYAFKMFMAATQHGLKQLYIHSNQYSSIIEKYVNQLEFKVNYVHGDIVPVLHNLVNCTYTTSDPNNIRKCMNVNVPFALTIVDDFQYQYPIVIDQKLIDDLREKNVYVQFTGVISAGII